MHICFIASEYPLPNKSFGGIGTFLLTYCDLLVKSGYRVSIVGVIKETEIQTEINGVHIYYKKRSTIKGLSWLKNSKTTGRIIKQVHQKNKIDIIESQEAGLAFVKIPKEIRKVVRMHGGHHFFHSFENKKLSFKKSILEKITFNKTDAVIATSDFVKKQTSKFLDFSNKENITINNPIPTEQFYPADKSKVIKGAIVFAGTVCEKKGIRQLCLALPKIREMFPEVHLYIYGRDWFFSDGTLYKNWMLNQFSDEIKHHITFRKPVPYKELPKVYEFGEICCFPSHMEVQGLVAPEAMCMEKVVVFTEYGPGPETIDDGINGFLCKPLEIDSISKTIIKALNNRKNNRFIEIAAREKVLKKFAPDNILNKNCTFYNYLLKKVY